MPRLGTRSCKCCCQRQHTPSPMRAFVQSQQRRMATSAQTSVLSSEKQELSPSSGGWHPNHRSLQRHPQSSLSQISTFPCRPSALQRCVRSSSIPYLSTTPTSAAKHRQFRSSASAWSGRCCIPKRLRGWGCGRQGAFSCTVHQDAARRSWCVRVLPRVASTSLQSRARRYDLAGPPTLRS